MILTVLEHKNVCNLAALRHTIFSKLHRVPHVILHMAVYILLRNFQMAQITK